MRIIYSLVITGAFCGCLYGAPPISGGFMTGPDSAVYVYWFHPDLYLYEQGIDGEVDELNLAPGDVPGEYSIAQKAHFPFMSFITDFYIEMNPGDDFPSLPGDQFSLFGYSAYVTGSDSMPFQPAVISDTNRLCGGIPCGDEWAKNRIDLLNLDGSDMWFGMEWMDSTTSAPQIKCAILPDAERYNKLGIKSGDFYSWNDLNYFAIFRYRFLTTIPADSSMVMGWRHDLIGENRPDSFLVRCFDIDYHDILAQYVVLADTLCLRLPHDQADSVEIIAFRGETLEDSSLVLTYDRTAKIPMLADIEFERSFPGSNSFDLIVINTGPAALDLTLGYDKGTIGGESQNVSLEAYATSSVPFEVNASEGDSLEMLIVIQDSDRRHYPFLARAPYPPQIPTDEANAVDSMPQDLAIITIRPNPCYQRAVISSKGMMRPAVVEIFNIIGQRVAEKILQPGQELVWEGRDLAGQNLPSGIYLARISPDGKATTAKKFILLR